MLLSAEDNIFKSCPGQDLSRNKIEEVICNFPCLECGADVEFFFDDKIRKCPECGTIVEKSETRFLKDFGCAEWCEVAKECIGQEKYFRLTKAKRESQKK